MRTILTFVLLIAGVLMLQVVVPDQAISTAVADTTYANPNGSSELALLMREMQAYSNQAKEDIAAGKKPAKYPAKFDKIHTAKISDSMSKSDYYNSFADLYIMSVKNYATSTSAQRVDTYNNMVNSCLACDSQHCPGPVPVIKKMMIKTDK